MLTDSDHRVDTFLHWLCSDDVSESSSKRVLTLEESLICNLPPVNTQEDLQKSSKKQKITPPQLFITNIPFSATQRSLRGFFDTREIPCDNLHLGRDPLGNFQGWCLISLPSDADTASLLPLVHGAIFEDRMLYASVGGDKEKIKFRLPEELIDRLRKIKDERNLTGCPAGKIADGYRRIYGEKFPAERYGFRTFVNALESIDGVQVALDPRTNQTLCTWP